MGAIPKAQTKIEKRIGLDSQIQSRPDGVSIRMVYIMSPARQSDIPHIDAQVVPFNPENRQRNSHENTEENKKSLSDATEKASKGSTIIRLDGKGQGENNSDGPNGVSDGFSSEMRDISKEIKKD